MNQQIRCSIFQLLASVSLFLTIHCSAQKYISDFEKTIFQSYQKDSTDFSFIQGLFAIDSVSSSFIEHSISLIDAEILKMPMREKKEKKEKKRIKFIYDAFHNTFLKKYNSSVFFSEIFKNGNYNCVTATALYCYVFEKLDIPYKVKDLPTHVYLIAYPDLYNIKLETTVPGEYGYYAPNEKNIKRAIDELISMKLITPDELNEKGYKNMYESYFYGNSALNKESLIGIQYYNKSIFDLIEEDFLTAENNIQKSLVFYQSPLSLIYYNDLKLYNLDNYEFDTIDEVMKLFEVFNNTENKDLLKKSKIEYYVYKITSNDNNDIDFLKKVDEAIKAINKEGVKNTFSEALYQYIVDSETADFNFESALEFGKKLLAINPKNKVGQSAISFSVWKISSLKESKKKAMAFIEDAYVTFPFLENDKKYMTVKAITLGEMVVFELKKRNVDGAEKYLKKLEELLDNKKESLMIQTSFYSYIYLTAGRYFYGKNRFAEAKALFKKGLKYVPENEELQKMYRWASEDLNDK